MADKEVRYRISLEGKNAEKNLNKLEQKTTSFEKKILNAGKAIGVVFAARAIGRAISNFTNLYDAQAQAVAQVEAGLKSTGGSVGRTLEDLTTQATKFQDQTIFGDEQILKDVTAQLLTFTGITGDQFDRTQQAAIDLSTRLGGDLKSSSIQLGKALNDPIANLGALSRSGIQFSKEQKGVIKSLAETGRLAEAQNIILTELEKQYGGSAKAARKAGTGGFKAFRNTLGDLQEVIGKRLISSTGNFSEKLNDLTKKAIRFVDVPLSETLRKTQFELNAEFNLLKKSNISVENRRELISDINRKYKDYIPNLLTEKSSLEEIKAAQDAANSSLLKRIEIQAKREILQEATSKAAQANKKLFEAQLDLEKVRLDLQNENGNIRREAARQELGLIDKVERRQKRAGKASEELLKLQQSLGDLSLSIDQTEADKALSKIKAPVLKPDAGITKITAASPKVFNITVQKMTGIETLNTTTIKEGIQQTGESVLEQLQIALADMQVVAS